MSYILDALKKSEQERQRGTVPDLLTVQETLLQTPRSRSPWQYIAVAVMVLGGVAAALLLLPLQGRLPAGPAAIHELPPASSEPAVSPGRELPVSGPAARRIEKRIPALQPPVTGAAEEKATLPPQALPARSSSGGERPASVLSEAEKPVLATTPAVPPADPARLYRIKELPAALQQLLQVFSLSAFMYSTNPELRMVRINGQMLHEGQELTPGTKLQEITTEGVILVSHGYRFFIAMK